MRKSGFEDLQDDVWLSQFIHGEPGADAPPADPGQDMAGDIRDEAWKGVGDMLADVREMLEEAGIGVGGLPFGDGGHPGVNGGTITVLYGAPELVNIGPPGTPGGGNGGGNGGGGNGGGGNGGGDDLLNAYTSGLGEGGYELSAYNVTINFLGDGWSADLQQVFIDAAEYISSIITGDVADVVLGDGTIIDDISIDASIEAIDGKGGILGMAGWDEVRSGGTDDWLPYDATMIFDERDVGFYNKVLGLFDDIVIHELLHAVGLGTIWDRLGLLDTTDPDNPLFLGEEAADAYAVEFGGIGYVPVEEGYGVGTALAHWDEETFGNELMTGIIDGSNYISDMTIASLEDLGYETIWDAASDMIA